MIYRRCQCGAKETYTEESPLCFECPYCHTTLVARGQPHERALPHRLKTEKAETDEGEKPITRCVWCGQTKADLIKAGAALAA